MTTYADQIAAFEAARETRVSRLKALADAASEKGETFDDAAREEVNTLKGEIKSLNEQINDLREIQEMVAASAKPVKGATEKDARDSRDLRIPAQVKTAKKLPPGIEVARIARVKALAKLDGESPRELSKQLYGEDSATHGFFMKGPVAAGTSSNSAWAAALISDESGPFADFVEFLRPMTILGKFGTGGIPSLRTVPFRTRLVTQSSGGSGYWVGEGKPKPLTKFDFTATTLEPLKVANIAVVTEEVLRNSSPAAEGILRDQLVAALRERLDIDFVDPDKPSVSGVSPASISFGVSPVIASGTDADAVRADIQAIFNAFIAADNPPTTGVWIMPATVALTLSLMLNPLGQPEFPGIGMNGGVFFGLPVIVSEYVPSDTNGAMLLLVNANDIYFADEGGFAVDMSREASLQMDDEPGTQDATTGTGTSLVSMWQTNSVAFRAERSLNWAKRRSSAVARLDRIRWAA